MDGADLHEAVRDLDPAETLFIVSSKTFTTIETITNATSARTWLLDGLVRLAEGLGFSAGFFFVILSGQPVTAPAGTGSRQACPAGPDPAMNDAEGM